MADARIGHESFEVHLGKGQNGPVDDPDHAQHHAQRGNLRRSTGHEGQGEAQESVSSGF